MNTSNVDFAETLRPLTAAQLGVWYAQMLAPQKPFYNIAEYLDIVGPIDLLVFEQALRRTMTENECSHIRLVETDDGPMQAIGPEPRWELEVIDVSASPEPLAVAMSWMRQNVQVVFDLAQGPLFRHALLRLSSDRHLWYQCGHHLCIDGYGAALMAQRVAALYSAL